MIKRKEAHMNETLHPLEDVMHEALPPSDFYPFTPAELAPADQHIWYIPSGEFMMTKFSTLSTLFLKATFLTR